ncbi:MAG: hypothetical protein AB1846_18215 [Chloroflexota bacterium]
MDAVAAPRQGGRVYARPGVEFEDAAPRRRVAAKMGVDLVPQAGQVRVVFGEGVVSGGGARKGFGNGREWIRRGDVASLREVLSPQ